MSVSVFFHLIVVVTEKKVKQKSTKIQMHIQILPLKFGQKHPTKIHRKKKKRERITCKFCLKRSLKVNIFMLMLIPCPDHCWHIKFCLVFQWHTVFSSHIVVVVRSHLSKHLHKVIMPARICVFNATAKIYASRKGNKNNNTTYCINKKTKRQKKNPKSRHT